MLTNKIFNASALSLHKDFFISFGVQNYNNFLNILFYMLIILIVGIIFLRSRTK